MHASIHPDNPMCVQVINLGPMCVLMLTGKCNHNLVPDEIAIHGQTPASLVILGEAIAAAGRKLDDQQKAAAIRAQLAEPLHSVDVAAIDAAGNRAADWTVEQILRREG